MDARLIDQLLDDAEASYQQAKTAYEAATVVRETAWRVANANDRSIRQIADRVGVSFQLVGRIIGRRRSLAA